MGAVLVLFLAGDVAEGVVQFDDGYRLRIPSDTVELGSPSLPAVAGVASARVVSPDFDKALTGRSLWSRRLNRLLATAEQMASQPIAALRLIVPPGLADDDLQAMIVAGHLAGCPRVDGIGLDQCLADRALTPIGRRHLLVQWDRRRLTVCALRIGATAPSILARASLTDTWSGEILAAELFDAMELFGLVRDKAMSPMIAALGQPSSAAPSQIFVANDRGAPDLIFIGHDIRRDIQQRVTARIAETLAAAGVELDQIDVVHLHGAWAPALAQHVAARSPGIEIQASSQMAAALEIAPPPSGETGRLAGDVIVDAGLADRIADAPDAKEITAKAGMALPLSRVFDSFPTSGILDDFSLYYDDGGGGALVTVGVAAIPRLLEGKAFSRLRLRVLADTERYLILAVNVAGLVDDSFIFDKARATWAQVEDEMSGAPSAAGRESGRDGR